MGLAVLQGGEGGTMFKLSVVALSLLPIICSAEGKNSDLPEIEFSTEAGLRLDFEQEISKQEAQIREILVTLQTSQEERQNKASKPNNAKGYPVQVRLISKTNPSGESQ